MRISATGRVDHTRAGFTLVELMMVIAIIGLAAGAVVLATPDPRPGVRAEAEALAARLTHAREEAVLSNRPIALAATAAGYAVEAYDGAHWSPLVEGPFKPVNWQGATTMVVEPEGARVVFDPTGAAEPATLVLTHGRDRALVVVDGVGQVRVDD